MNNAQNSSTDLGPNGAKLTQEQLMVLEVARRIQKEREAKKCAKWLRANFDGSESLLLPGLCDGDLVMHFRTSMWNTTPEVLDFWIMNGGEIFSITNKEEEFPPGFELHYTEARKAHAHTVARRIKERGHPGEVMHSLNIWRVKAGDRVVLIGERSWLDGGVMLHVHDFSECALVFWMHDDGEWPTVEEMIELGSKQGQEPQISWGKVAVQKVIAMGTPSSIAEDWRLG